MVSCIEANERGLYKWVNSYTASNDMGVECSTYKVSTEPNGRRNSFNKIGEREVVGWGSVGEHVREQLNGLVGLANMEIASN